jgi:FHS family L-fucose permease-like MFS transporter
MQKTSKRSQSAIVIIGVLFFIFGFVTWLNSTLIQYLKLICELQNDLLAFLVTFAFYISYVFLAIPSALILQKTGYKNGMALGLFVMSLGFLLFVPAAHSRNFAIFLAGLFVQGMGLTLLQAASNPYISILGPLESAARRMSIMGICNKSAGGLVPLIMGAVILKNATALDNQIHTATDPIQKEALLSALAARIVLPYLIMAGVLIVLSVLINRSHLPEIKSELEEAPIDPNNKLAAPRTSVTQFPHLMLGVLCIFLYVGVEVLAGDGIGVFGKAIGMTLDKTKYFTTFTMFAMLAGYIVGIITIPKYISQSFALKVCSWLGLAFGTAILFTTGYTAITFVALLGLANSLMWPAIWPLALEGLGKFTKSGSALLVMGIAGAAIMPLIYPALKDNAHLPNNLAFCVVILPSYVYILYYAVSGHKAGKRSGAAVHGAAVHP